jgi:simple sugar transport system ATP-binding protein/ribose transport system ATP-binding protein
MPAAPESAGSVLLSCRSLSKAFGGTKALTDVSLDIRAGTVHAFVGENGAGKSTLGKIIAGVIAPDRGELVLRGQHVSFASPRAARDHGIAQVAQELALVPGMSVADNVFLGVEPRRAGFVRRGELSTRFERLVAEAGFHVPADVPVGGLPVAQQQQVEILRALASEADLLVLDEPTAALSGEEAERLHDIVRGLAARGRTVVLISHFLAEVLELADTVSILRDGQIVRTAPAADESEDSLVSGMLGRSLTLTYPPKQAAAEDAPVVLRLRDVVAPGVDGVSLEVRAGEIVGLAGLIGAGRSELAQAIFGGSELRAGTVEIEGAPSWRSPRGALDAGVALIPESRKEQGLMLGRPVRENVGLASLGAMSRWGWVRRRTERRNVAAALERSTVQASTEQPAGTLSGGNQQKLLFARAVLVAPRLLIADEPTRGIDVGAKRAIYEMLTEFAAKGVGVLLISSEMEEILGLAHRVIVMRAGSISASLDGDGISEAAILQAAFATGAQAA